MRIAATEAMAELGEEARALGPDVVIGVDLDYEVVGERGGMLMVPISGTAVNLTRNHANCGSTKISL